MTPLHLAPPRRIWMWIASAWLSLVVSAGTCRAQGTDVNTNITTSTTWTSAGSPYRIHGVISVLQGASLDIQAGVQVLFDDATSLIVGGASSGALQATGTAGAPVVFRRNGPPLAGAWAGLQFLGGTFGSSLVNCQIQDAGQSGQSILCAGGAAPSLQNISVSNGGAAGIGLLVQASAPVLSGSFTLSGSSGYAFDASNSASSPTFSAGFAVTTSGALGRGPVAMWSSFFGSNPGTSGTALTADIYGGSVTQSAAWGGLSGVTLHLMGSLIIRRVTGTIAPILTLRPGTLLKLDPGAQIQVGTSAGAPGGLIGDGTAAQPVEITSTNPAQTSARWANIIFHPSSTSDSRLTHSALRNGGTAIAAVYCAGSSPALSNVTIEDVSLKGLYLTDGSPALSNCTFRRITQHAVYAETGASLPACTGSLTFDSVGSLGYGTPEFWQHLLSAAVSVPGGPYAQEVVNGVLTLGSTWGAPISNPIRLLGTLDVHGPAAPVLTLRAGTTLELADGAAINIGTTTGESGTLIASGTQSAPIVFLPSQGQRWDAVYLNQFSSSASRLDWCNFVSCGRHASAGLLCYGPAAPTLNNISVTDPTPLGDGIVLDAGASPGLGGNLTLAGSSGTLVRTTMTTSQPAFTAPVISTSGKIGAGGAQFWTNFFDSGPAVPPNAVADVFGDLMTWSATWGLQGVVLHLIDDLFVAGPNAPRLTLRAGTIVRIDAGNSLRVGSASNQGGLWALGTAATPIRFENAEAGSWGKVQINNCPVTGQVTLQYCQFAGSGAPELSDPQCAILVRSGKPILGDLAFASTLGDGIYVEGNGQATLGGSLGFTGSSGRYLVRADSVFAQILGTSSSPAVLSSNALLARMSATSWSSYFSAGSSIVGGPYDAEVLAGSLDASSAWGGVPGLALRLLGDLSIGSGATLTLQPGTQVKLDANASIRVGQSSLGSLQAVGTAPAPISFSGTSGATWGMLACYSGSMRLERCNLGGGGAAAVGNIVYNAAATSVLQDVQITSSASTGVFLSAGTLTNVSLSNCLGDGVRVPTGSPTISQVTVSSCSAEGLDLGNSNAVVTGLSVTNCQSDGVRLTLSSPQVSGLSVSGCSGYALNAMDASSVPTFASVTLSPVAGKLGRGSADLWARLLNSSPTISGTGMTQEVLASTLSLDTTWSSLGGALAIRLLGDLKIDGAAARLTLLPGTTVRLDPTFSVLVGTIAGPTGAALYASGTPASPVRFERAGASAWGRIGFGAQASGPLSRLSDCQIADGGSSVAALDVTGVAPLLQSVAISNSSSDGLRIQTGAPVVNSTSIAGAVGHGLVLTSSNASVSNLTISGCGGDGLRLSTSSPGLAGLNISTASGYAIQALDVTSAPTFASITLTPVAGRLGRGSANLWARLINSGPTISGTGMTQEVLASTLSLDTTWSSLGGALAIRLLGDLKIDGATARLTLLPGTTVRLDPTFSVLVGTVAGPTGAALYASGTPASPVRFERAGASAWGRIGFGAQASGPLSRLSECQIADGGSSIAALDVTGAAPLLQSVAISNSGSDGVRITSSTLSLLRLTVTNAAGAGVRSVNANSTIASSTLQANQIGLRVEGTSGSASAINNSITANSSAAVQSVLASTVTARLNWWGSANGPTAGSITGNVSYDPWLGSALLGPTAWMDAQQSPDPFNQYVSSTSFTGSFDQVANWTISILSGPTTVKTYTGVGATFSQDWGGDNSAGTDLPNGTYTFHVDASSGAGAATQAIGLVTLDDSAPFADILSPVANQRLSGTVPVTGTATAVPLTQWVLEYGAGLSPSSYTTISSGTSPVTNASLGSWNTSGLNQTVYTLRLRVVSGTTTVSDSVPVHMFVIQNVTATSAPIDPYSGQTATIQYTLGGPGDVVARLYDSSTNTLVRQIDAPGQVEGTNQIVWDGRDGNGQVALPSDRPAEAYYFTLLATNPSAGNATYNVAGSPLPGVAPFWVNNTATAQIPPAPDWAYRNDVVSLAFTLSGRGRFNIRATSAAGGATIANIAQNKINTTTDAQTLTWNGRVQSGNAICGVPFNFFFDVPVSIPLNAIVLERPLNSFANFRSQPYVFLPLYGQVCTFEYSLNADSYVDIDIFDPSGNQCCALMTGQTQTAGPQEATWDGLDSSGRLVSNPGSTYSVRIRAIEIATGRVSTDLKTVSLFR